MKTKNTRYLDAQGRVILPNHIRKELNLKGGSAVDVEMDDDGTIKIRPADNRCALCGEQVEPGKCGEIGVGPYPKKYICLNCGKIIVRSMTRE